MEKFLFITLILYVIIIFAASFYARSKVKTESDFLIAGRRLSLPFTTATLFATWFGAGTLLTATEQVRQHGLKAAALEPYGAGFCLIIAGIFFAKPLWETKLLTLADFFRLRFGKRAEEVSIFLACPGFIAWIAVQLMAAAEVLQITLAIPSSIGIAVVGAIAMSYTLIGGMWSIAYLDSFQIVIIFTGLIVIFFEVLAFWGHGSFLEGLNLMLSSAGLNESMSFSLEQIQSSALFLNVFVIAALGNIPSQDFTQRVFSAKSPRVAQYACLIAGLLYVSIGSIPVVLGLASRVLLPEVEDGMVVITMAQRFVSPAFSILFILSIIAAIFSTLDSSILATASPLSHNFLRRYVNPKISSLRLCQYAIVVIGFLGIALAYTGSHMYSLLEAAYSSSLAVFFAPLVIGIYGKRHHPTAALVSMLSGGLIWFFDIFFSRIGFPLTIYAALLSYASYYIYLALFDRKQALSK